jgi:hypothetical protein
VALPLRALQALAGEREKRRMAGRRQTKGHAPMDSVIVVLFVLSLFVHFAAYHRLRIANDQISGLHVRLDAIEGLLIKSIERKLLDERKQ